MKKILAYFIISILVVSAAIGISMFVTWGRPFSAWGSDDRFLFAFITLSFTGLSIAAYEINYK